MAELLRYRFLFEQMVRRELRQKYQGSIFGLAWYLINPIVLMGAYYLMFGVALKPGFHHDDYPLFLMVGIVVWTFYSQSVISAAPSLPDQGALIRKARFPRETLPGSVVTVMQAGYELFGRVIRPAMVMVTPKTGAAAPAAGEGYASAAADPAGSAFDAKA